LDVPEAVVIVTGTVGGGSDMAGTVTVQLVWIGQTVGATCPSKLARTLPSELMNPMPTTTTD